jgi:carbon storage regulator CsrA
MLVLTRKLQEQIKIGDEIVVTILQVRGQSVRVGIQAPKNVRVLRAELPVKLANGQEGGGGGARITAIELQPGKAPTVKNRQHTSASDKATSAGASMGRPLAKKLQARRAPKPHSTNATTPMTGRLGPAIVALAEVAG